MDLTLHDIRLAAHSGERLDLAVAGGRIAAIGPDLPRGTVAQDLGGRLLVPGFCEAHVHLDKACILERCAGADGIPGAIAETARVKAAFTEADVAARAGRALAKCVSHGTMRMRTHVEVDPRIGLRGFEGVKAALADWSWALDAEICVFPQEGMTNEPGTEALMRAALADGAAVVGACPYADTDPEGQIARVFALAREFDADIDMHLDFGAGAEVMTIDRVIRETEAAGWGGRVTVGHATRWAALDAGGIGALGRRLAEAGVAVTALPATDLFLMHRGHARDMDPPRGLAPLTALAAEGVRCAISTNNILNPFTPFGDGSAMRMANLHANIAQIGTPGGMAACLDMICEGAARILRAEGHRLAVGARADMVALDAPDPATAVAELAPALMGWRAGRRSFTRPAPALHPPGAD